MGTKASSPGRRKSWPSKHAALLVPIAEHDAFGDLAVNLETMRCRPVRVAVNQRAHAVLSHSGENGSLIHIHDLGFCSGGVLDALGARLRGEGMAFAERAGAKL